MVVSRIPSVQSLLAASLLLNAVAYVDLSRVSLPAMVDFALSG